MSDFYVKGGKEEPSKQYGSPEEYEEKLKRVMERFGVDE
jgi:hypothetical protein